MFPDFTVKTALFVPSSPGPSWTPEDEAVLSCTCAQAERPVSNEGLLSLCPSPVQYSGTDGPGPSRLPRGSARAWAWLKTFGATTATGIKVARRKTVLSSRESLSGVSFPPRATVRMDRMRL